MIEKIKERYQLLKNRVKDKIFQIDESSEKAKIILMSFVVVVVSLVIMIFVISGDTTKEMVLNDFKTAIETEDARLLAKCIRVDDNKVSKTEIIPLLNYYKEKQYNILAVIKELRATNVSGLLNIKVKDNLINEEYYINVEKVDVDVRCNIKETEINFNNKLVKAGDVIKGVVPGNYEVTFKLRTDFGDVEGKEQVVIADEHSIDINVNAAYITLYSDFNDADVYINNKNTSKKVEEIVDFGPIPLNDNVKLYIEKEFPWGKIKSYEITINNGGLISLNINMVNDKLLADVDNILNQFFSSVFEALNENDKSLIINADENTKDKIYDDIFKKTLFFSNNYKIDDLSLKIENSEFEYESGTYKGNMVVKINYDISKKILPFIKESHEELFLIGLEYEDNTWIAKSVQRFNMYSE